MCVCGRKRESLHSQCFSGPLEQRAAGLGVNMEGKHQHVPQSSALVLPLWNFDTEMPKVRALVYPNSPQDLVHTSQL